MLVRRPPRLYRALYPRATWRGPYFDSLGRPAIYLTFDDGPVPEVTPAVLEILDRQGVKATFFVVADNAVRYPELFDTLRKRGHAVGNHTFHHLQGIKTPSADYLGDVALADTVVRSGLFRAPHGLMRRAQYKALAERYKIVFHDLVTRDYSSRLCPEDVFDNVRRLARPGSVIVFHDSVKARENVLGALERSIEWLKSQGYVFHLLEP
ncbi:MAG: polysaccharide deacetylase family protein [Muribaculaceae bacterium]|nr:polysaccharide deacetylase family protein [Muribaculaceae bacterium]